jgi:hypothetical protein
MLRRVALLFSLSQWTCAQITDQPRDQPTLVRADITDKCCIYLQDEAKLLDCANRSAYQFVSNSNPSVIAVSYSTEGILDYGAYSMAVNTYYTQLHGYGMVLLTPALGAQYEPRDQRWNKVKILMNALDPLTGWAKDTDFIVWLDSDLIFLDMGLQFEEVVKAHPSHDMIFSADGDVQNGIVTPIHRLVDLTAPSQGSLIRVVSSSKTRTGPACSCRNGGAPMIECLEWINTSLPASGNKSQM